MDATVVIMNTDGSGRTEIARGALVGPAGTDRVAFIRNDSVFVATWQNGRWSSISIYGVPDSTYRIGHASVALSPDGTMVTFTTRMDMGNTTYVDTYLAAADGSGIGAPLPMSLVNGYTPVFSRDSRKLAFYGQPSSLQDGFSSTSRACVFNTSGRDYIEVADLGRIGSDGGVSMDFSPDGSKLVYSAKNQETQITSAYIANSGEGGTSRVFATGAYYPIWSHDGRKIFYIGGFNFDIMVANADGSGTVTNLTNTVGQVEVCPQLSPDGKKLAYAQFPGNAGDAPGAIKVMEVNNPSNITTISSIGYRAFWVQNSR